jgi:1-pyrroline-5-carboxylate dehydrogenase
MSFRLTYATMFDPPAEMHERFDAALARVGTRLGARHELFVDGVDRGAQQHAHRSTSR